MLQWVSLSLHSSKKVLISFKTQTGIMKVREIRKFMNQL
jgi:hypothetical protein